MVVDLGARRIIRSEEHTSELQSRLHLVCRLLLEKKENTPTSTEGRSVPRAPAEQPARAGPRVTGSAARRGWLLACGPGDGRGRVFFNDTATTEIYTLSLHDALPI